MPQPFALLLPGEHSPLGRLGFAIGLTPFFSKCALFTSFSRHLLCSKPLGTPPENELQTHAQYAPLPEIFGTLALQACGAKARLCPGKEVEFTCVLLFGGIGPTG